MSLPAQTLPQILRRAGKLVLARRSLLSFLVGAKSLLLCTGLSSFLVKLASNKLVVAKQIKSKQPPSPLNASFVLVPMLVDGVRYEGISLLVTHSLKCRFRNAGIPCGDINSAKFV